MSIFDVCSGCLKVTRKTALKKRGVFNASYCPECLVAVSCFITERDVLHDKVQSKWRKGIKKIEKRCRKKDIKRLPDEYEA